MSRFLAPSRSSSRAVAAQDPFSDLHREMNRLFDDFLVGGPLGTARTLMASPRLDMRESQQELCIAAELPGVKPEDVEIRIEGSMLTLRGEKANEAEEKKEDYYLMERSYGRFQRSLQLPYSPDPDQVRAQFDNGVLTIHVPKEAQQERSRRVEIQSQGRPIPQAVTKPTHSEPGAQQH